MITQPHSPPRNRKLRRILTGGLLLVLILVTGIAIAGAVAKSNLHRQNPAPGQLVDVGGYRMHLQCLGQGSPTVILVGGLDDFSITWSLVQRMSWTSFDSSRNS